MKKVENINIRVATLKDYESLNLLYNELDEMHRSHHPEIFVDNLKDIRGIKDLEEILENPNKNLFVATIDSEIVGFVECYISSTPNVPVFKKRKWVQLSLIIVKDEYRLLNIGTLLFEKVKEWAKENKIYEIELIAYSFNSKAISFYENKGFKEISKKMYLEIK